MAAAPARRPEKVAKWVAQLRTGGEGEKAQAANELGISACRGKPAQDMIVQAGALAPLVVLLANGESDKEKGGAAFALKCLAYGNADNRVLIADAGAVAPLMALLASGSDDVKMLSAGALQFLAEDNAVNQAAIVEAGAIESLVDLMTNGSDGLLSSKSQAKNTLKALGQNVDFLTEQAPGNLVKSASKR